MSASDSEFIILFCEEAMELLMDWESVCLTLARKEDVTEGLNRLFRAAHNLKGGSRAVGLIALGDFIHKVEDGITLHREGKIALNDELLALILEAQKHLSEWILKIKVDPGHVQDVDNFLERYLVNYKEPYGAPAGSAMQEEKHQEKHEETPVDLSNLFDEHAKNYSAEALSVIEAKKKVVQESVAPAKVNGNQESLRISALKLDQLIQTLGELSIHQSIIWHTKTDTMTANKMFVNSLQLSQKLTKDLYDRALGLRMQPLQNIFQRLERNILEVSHNLGKKVQVVIEGAEVELDKTVLEKIVDPLTHIVRNAVDHGLEITAERIEKGKPPEGRVTVSAEQDVSGVIITISDDGKGLIPEKLLKKAREKGLVAENEQFNRDSILNLIFLPGFSTAEKLTDVSGRGVGMDVVRTTLKQLQGHIRIQTEENKGTAFIITLPTSVSIIEVMLIELEGQNFVAPLGSIEEVVNAAGEDLSPGMRMFDHQDQVLPLVDLGDLLMGRNQKRTNQRRAVLISECDGEKIGFWVDRTMGQQQIVVRPLNKNLDGVVGIMGGTILGNGEPGLILDLAGLARRYFKSVGLKELSA